MQIWGNMIPALTVLPEQGWCRRDALIKSESANLVLCTHSGSRSPVRKAYNGEAAGLICYNSGGGGWGGRWTAVLLVAPVGHGAQAVMLQDPSQGVSRATVQFTYHGKDYYATTISSNPTWGGPASYDGYNNVLGLPELWDVQVFEVNGAPFRTEVAETVGDLLRLR